jgi:hypothetical protein
MYECDQEGGNEGNWDCIWKQLDIVWKVKCLFYIEIEGGFDIVGNFKNTER